MQPAQLGPGKNVEEAQSSHRRSTARLANRSNIQCTMVGGDLRTLEHPGTGGTIHAYWPPVVQYLHSMECAQSSNLATPKILAVSRPIIKKETKKRMSRFVIESSSGLNSEANKYLDTREFQTEISKVPVLT